MDSKIDMRADLCGRRCAIEQFKRASQLSEGLQQQLVLSGRLGISHFFVPHHAHGSFSAIHLDLIVAAGKCILSPSRGRFVQIRATKGKWPDISLHADALKFNRFGDMVNGELTRSI